MSIIHGGRKNSDINVQIDLAIERADNIVTICEIKYSKDEYTLVKEEYGKIIKRSNVFAEEHTKKGVQVVMVTTFGVKRHHFSEIMTRGVVLDDLFQKLYGD